MSKSLAEFIDFDSARHGAVYVDLTEENVKKVFQIAKKVADEVDFVTSAYPTFSEKGAKLEVVLKSTDSGYNGRYFDDERKATLIELFAPKYARQAKVTARVMRDGHGNYQGTLVDLRLTGDDTATGKEVRELVASGVEGVNRARVSDNGRTVVFSLSAAHKTDVDGEITAVARTFGDALGVRVIETADVHDSNPDADLL